MSCKIASAANAAEVPCPGAPPHKVIRNIRQLPFKEIWVVDTEYNGGFDEEPVPGNYRKHGNPVNPVCIVARELHSGQEIRLWRDQLGLKPPYPIHEHSLFVCFNAAAEMSFHNACGWGERPRRILDLFPEYCNVWNGLTTVSIRKPDGTISKRSLLCALAQYNIRAISASEKDAAQDAILAGGPWTQEQKNGFLTYNASDVDETVQLFLAMLPDMFPNEDNLQRDLHFALLRGRFMGCLASVSGSPIDVELLHRFDRNRQAIIDDLIEEYALKFPVFEDGSFKESLFAKLVHDWDIPWPRTSTGKLATDKKTLEKTLRDRPDLQDLSILLATKSSLERASVIKGEVSDKKTKTGLVVGRDGRNRVGLFPFGTLTMRNAPSTAECIWGWPAWLRSLIKPGLGRVLIYLDYRQQEVGIAAAHSGDKARRKGYRSGDVYEATAKRIGMIPTQGSAESHPKERAICKQLELSIQYGAGPGLIAARTGLSLAHGRKLLKQHHEAYPVFWSWVEDVARHARWFGHITTALGWVLHVTGKTKKRTIMNYPMQSHGSHMMQLALCYAVEDGIDVCAIVHDAFLIEASERDSGIIARRMERHMRRASREVLDGFEIDVDIHYTEFPHRYVDKRDVDDKDTRKVPIEEKKRIWWPKMLSALEKAEKK